MLTLRGELYDASKALVDSALFCSISIATNRFVHATVVVVVLYIGRIQSWAPLKSK